MNMSPERIVPRPSRGLAALLAVAASCLAVACSDDEPGRAGPPLPEQSSPDQGESADTDPVEQQPAAGPQPTSKPSAETSGNAGAILPTLAALNIPEARLETVVAGLDRPWSFEFLNDDEIIITEINGTMRRFDRRAGELTAIAGVPEVAAGQQQTGLLDVALHPDFADNRRLYFSYVISDDTGRYYKTVIDTARLAGDRLEAVERLLSADPFGWSVSNFGGVMAFDGAGRLYITIGDRSEQAVAQNGSRLQGKILRLDPDGSVPADNPFVDDPTVDDRVYALGVRNPQGLHYDPVTGNLYEAEHGPMGGDEVNRIEAGANYGWPVVSYGQNYTPEAMGFRADQLDNSLARLQLAMAPSRRIGQGTHGEGFRQPLFYYLPSTATSPLTQYRGEMFPEWEGDLLVGALKGKHVSKLDLDGGVIRSEYPMLTEIGDRVRDLKVAADGSIWILGQAGILHRLYRPQDDAAGAMPEPARPGEAVYEFVCAGCHDTGASGAPIPQQPGQWTEILERPVETAYRRTLEGYGEMPARGLCDRCSDALLRRTVDYMLERARSAQDRDGDH